jgi:hypothetical protein
MSGCREDLVVEFRAVVLFDAARRNGTMIAVVARARFIEDLVTQQVLVATT